MNTDKFSVDYFKEALTLHVEKNKDYVTFTHAMNSFYRSMVSTIIADNLNKNFELIRRLKNLDQAYNDVKEELSEKNSERPKA
ncbi:protein YvfG [Pullulanibacillus sp. KACC 23026]|uniref:protein YvfG n=1 Tax=Pullulanibacillus sp. KACC 23026 TaxID=3028315 RepID=UPI0023B0D9C6|nr:protein YvfG [Pullulanibacillus sp. KACC 23026]WEG12162.1 protein YvfG [Pullulanibacillus sp. KACC 23026]